MKIYSSFRGVFNGFWLCFFRYLIQYNVDIPPSGTNATVVGAVGHHGGRVTVSVMAAIVVHDGCTIQLNPGVLTISAHALQTIWDSTIRGVMNFVIMEEHLMATIVDVLQDFMDHAADCVRIIYDKLHFF